MWIVTREGFFSVCRRSDDPEGYLRVRSRSKEDLERLIKVAKLPRNRTIERRTVDYPWHLLVSARTLGRYMAREMQAVRYPSCKDALCEGHRPRRHGTYMRVWSVLREIELEEGAT